jgi:tetratricopeptide (TPR) repeat protein
LSIDPLSQETLFYSGYFHYMIEDYHIALEQLDKCLVQNPKNIPVHSVKCRCLLKIGRYDEVINYFDTMLPEIVVPGDKLGLTALAYALKKDSSNTSKYLVQLLEDAKGPGGFTAHSFLILVYAIMGENDKAFEWINRSVENKSSLLLFNFADPLVQPIKDDPRYFEFHKIIYGSISPSPKIL